MSYSSVPNAEQDTVSKRLRTVSKALDMKENHIDCIWSAVGIFADGVEKSDSSCCPKNNDDEEDHNIQLILLPQVIVASISEAQTLFPHVDFHYYIKCHGKNIGKDFPAFSG